MFKNIEKLFKKHTFFLIFIASSLQIKGEQSVKSCPIMTVFVHGIIKPPWTIRDLFHIACNNIEQTRYKLASEYLRNNPEYFLTQPMQDLGLKEIDTTCAYPTCAAAAIASVYKMINPDEQDLYYTFGWSGFFNKYYRESDAKIFYDSLIAELARLKELNIYPKLRIVSFSHGGNVAINLAKHISYNNPEICIDRLMLIGTPIQYENDYLINHPAFEKIYNFYSANDIVQASDFLTTKYGVSNQIFKSRKNFTIPDKLTQVQVRVTKVVKDSNGKTVRTIIKDPNHHELWAFGWVQRIYREKFPLHPLPMAAFIPIMINSIDSVYEAGTDLKIDIIPKLGTIKIKNKKTKAKYCVEFSEQKLNELKRCALNFKADFAYYKHVQLVKDALSYAHNQRKIVRQKRNKMSLKFGSKKINCS